MYPDPASPPRVALTLTSAHRFLYLIALIFGLLAPIQGAFAADGDRVGWLRVDGAITPVMASYVERGIDRAAQRGDTAVVLQMDTPGGLSSAMDDIIADILDAPIPVIVYVAPDGARAASAGVYISYAAHVAAMAPATNIGSATPVQLGGEDDAELSTMERKVINDAVAKIRALAEKRGRNADWAEQAVRDAANITASQAADLHVVDFIAANRDELLAMADGRQVEVRGQIVTVRTAGASIDKIDMTFFERALQVVSNPDIAFVLLSIGTLAVIFELANPGLILPGVLGGLMMLTGFYSLGTLDSNWTGLALIAFAFVLFGAEVFVTSHGVLTAGGIAAFLFGSLLLASSQDAEVLRLSRTVIFTMTLLVGSFFVLIVGSAWRVRSQPPATGVRSLVGKAGVARTRLDPTGMIYMNGELWQATSSAGPVEAGERVLVTAISGLHLTVTPQGATTPPADAQPVGTGAAVSTLAPPATRFRLLGRRIR